MFKEWQLATTHDATEVDGNWRPVDASGEQFRDQNGERSLWSNWRLHLALRAESFKTEALENEILAEVQEERWMEARRRTKSNKEYVHSWSWRWCWWIISTSPTQRQNSDFPKLAKWIDNKRRKIFTKFQPKSRDSHRFRIQKIEEMHRDNAACMKIQKRLDFEGNFAWKGGETG